MKPYVYYFEFGFIKRSAKPLTDSEIAKIENKEGWLLWHEKENENEEVA